MPNPGVPIITMRDVAKASGVSQSTVSRVLSGAPTAVPIAPETRERVLADAKRLGYRPNPLARGLRGSRTMLLGVIAREITGGHWSGPRFFGLTGRASPDSKDEVAETDDA